MDSIKIIKKHGQPGGMPVITVYVDEDAPGEDKSLYVHYVSLSTFAQFVVVTKDSTPFTVSTLAKWLKDNGFTSYTGTYLPCHTVFSVATPSTSNNTFKIYKAVCVFSSDGTSVTLQQENTTISLSEGVFSSSSETQLRPMSTIADRVVQI